MSDVIEVAVEIRRETERAYLVFDGDHEVWLPKSQCTWLPDERVMEMPEWLAMREGLI